MNHANLTQFPNKQVFHFSSLKGQFTITHVIMLARMEYIHPDCFDAHFVKIAPYFICFVLLEVP